MISCSVADVVNLSRMSYYSEDNKYSVIISDNNYNGLLTDKTVYSIN